MDDRAALTAAIISHPAEDTPRLALADWLQEHGDKHDQARAEFIRAQVRAAALPPGKERDKLDASAAKLEAKHRKAWLAPLAAFGTKLARYLDTGSFRRGLVQYVFVDTSEFLLKKHQAQLPGAFAAIGVEELNFFSATKRLDALTASPAIRFVSHIQYPGADDAALAAFGASPHFAHLSGLELKEALVTDKGLKAFAATATMPNLRAFNITTEGPLTTRKAKFTSAGLLALLKSGRFPRLDSLEVGGATPAAFRVAEFFTDPALAQLKHLTFGIPVPAAIVFATPHLKNLRSLVLHESVTSDDDANTLLGNRAFANLKELSLAPLTPLAAATEAKLRKRFGDGLNLDYLE